jgi:hypothetical protein
MFLNYDITGFNTVSGHFVDSSARHKHNPINSRDKPQPYRRCGQMEKRCQLAEGRMTLDSMLLQMLSLFLERR